MDMDQERIERLAYALANANPEHGRFAYWSQRCGETFNLPLADLSRMGADRVALQRVKAVIEKVALDKRVVFSSWAGIRCANVVYFDLEDLQHAVDVIEAVDLGSKEVA